MNYPYGQQMGQYSYDPNMNMVGFDPQMYQEYAYYYLGGPPTPPPPKGPYPGITHEDYELFDINKQILFQRFLGETAAYYAKHLPKYQKEMEEFLNTNTAYQMNESEKQLMQSYLDYKKKEKEYESFLKSLEQTTQASNPEQEQQKLLEQQKLEQQKLEQQKLEEQKKQQQLEQQKQQQLQQQQQQQQQEQPKEGATTTARPKKKLNLNAKPLEIPLNPPKMPNFPKHPDFVDFDKFWNNYSAYISFYNPSCEEEYKTYPKPEQQKKKEADEEAKRKKKQEEIERAIKKRQDAEQRAKDKPTQSINLVEQVVKLEGEVDLQKYVDPDETRQPVNLVFIGHVDAGKSTLCGRLLLELGEVSEADIKKYEQEAVQNNRDSWWLAYVMDQNEEEKQKGKTVECGKAQFVTKQKRFILADAPGHKNYVPNMIMGACQADLAGLIISAKTGEFESGFEKGGQTQEHALLAKSLGVDHIIIIVTKMDTIEWNQDRFNMISQNIQEFVLKQCKFENIYVIPIDALSGANIKNKVEDSKCNWYKGPSLIDLIDTVAIPKRNEEGPIRMPILDKFKDLGSLYIYGKLESGKIIEGLDVSIYPKKQPFQIVELYNMKDQKMKYAKAGENIKIKVKNIEEEDIKRGFMMCNLTSNPCLVSQEFQARIRLLDLPESRRIFSEGYQCIMHLHSAVEEIEVSCVEAVIDAETKKSIKQNFLKSFNEGIAKISIKNPVCMEKYETLTQLGRFALRDDGKTIGFGEILKVKPIKQG